MAHFSPFADWEYPKFDPSLDDGRRGLLRREYTAYNDGSLQSYSLYVPSIYTPDRPHSLVIALHGLGQTDEAVISEAFQKIADQNGYLAAAPSGRGRRNYFRGPGEDDVLRVTEEMRKQYHVDPDRIYLTGVSMGGSGSMHIGLDMPDRWAAVYPVCGLYTIGYGGLPIEADQDPYELNMGGDVSFVAENGYNLAMGMAHGDIDPVVPIEQGRRMIERFRELGYQQIVYKEYPDFPHGDPDIFDRLQWLESHRLYRHPRKVVFKTFSLHHDRAYWVRVEDFTQFNRSGLIIAEALLGNKIKVETENLAQISLYMDSHLLDLKAPVEVEIDGKMEPVRYQLIVAHDNVPSMFHREIQTKLAETRAGFARRLNNMVSRMARVRP